MPSTTVQSGQSLASIARAKKVNLLDLIRANPQISNPNLIQPGQQIRIPSGTYSASERSKAAVRAGMSATGRPEDIGKYSVNEQGQLVQTNFAPVIAESPLAPQLTQPSQLVSPYTGRRPGGGGAPALPQLTQPTQLVSPYTGRRAGGIPQARQGTQPSQLVSPYTGRSAGGEAIPVPRQMTYPETAAALSRMAAKGGAAIVRGGQSILSAAATALPQPYEGAAQAAISAAGTLGRNALQTYYGQFIPSVFESWGRRTPPPVVQGPGQGREGAPMFPPGQEASSLAATQIFRQEPTRRAVGTGRSVAGTTPAYQSPDVQQLQEQNWDKHIGTVALQLLSGQGLPTYTMSRIIDDPRFRNVLIAYFSNAGVDVSGLTTLELLEIMGYKKVDGDIWYRQDNRAATGGVGTFGGTVYSGGYSGGGYSRGGGGGSRLGGGGGGGGSRLGGFSYGLVDWRIQS